MEISGLDDYLHLSDAGYLWMVSAYVEPAMIMVRLIFFLVSTLGQENSLYGSVCSLGLGFILMMLEDKLYDMLLTFYMEA